MKVVLSTQKAEKSGWLKKDPQGGLTVGTEGREGKKKAGGDLTKNRNYLGFTRR